MEEKIRNSIIENQFITPSFQIYGALGGFQDYGPFGKKIKLNLIKVWREIFTDLPEIYEIETPIVNPYNVLKASGHVDRFTDYVVLDQNGKMERVDHFLEDLFKVLLLKDDVSNKNLIQEHLNNIDNFSKDELQGIMNNYKSFFEDREFSEVFEQNLMVESKTDFSNKNSFLRPETAQGTFVNFKNVYRLHGETLPMGIVQIGKVYRREINTKPFFRLREFEQAELEYFYDPLDTECSNFDEIRDMKLPLLSQQDQIDGNSSQILTIEDAMKIDIIQNKKLAYFMSLIYRFAIRIGLDLQKVRFRQHLPNEMAHYASDCWDLECLIHCTNSDGNPDTKWIEVIGCADRGCFDLKNHQQHSKKSMMARRIYDVPKKVTGIELKFNMKEWGKTFKSDQKRYKEYLLELVNSNPNRLNEILSELENKVSYLVTDIYEGREDEIPFIITKELLSSKNTTKEINFEDFLPSVIEPSFGIDRLIYSLLDHSFFVRDISDNNEGEVNEDRIVFSLCGEIAPIKVCILPLYRKDFMLKYIPWIERIIRKKKIPYKIDKTSASIGKKYSRMDEIGVVYSITIDHQTDEDHTVTVRDRDSMEQYRVHIDDLLDRIN